jgi:hypothetical protein
MHEIVEVMYFLIGFVFVFFILVAIYITYVALLDAFFFFLLIPISGVIYFSTIFIFKHPPSLDLNKLALFDKIIYSLYLTAFILLVLIIINPASDPSIWFYYLVLNNLYVFYPILWIPLIIVILLTLYYLKLNIPIEKRRLAKFMIALFFIVVLFFGIYILLQVSVGPLFEFYRNLEESDPDFIYPDFIYNLFLLQ